MQMTCALLIFQEPELPLPLDTLSPASGVIRETWRYR